MQGTVTKSTGSWYHVLTDDGKVWLARTRGKLRLNDLDTSNPVAVGDRVEMQADLNYPDTASISKVEPRNNYLIRRSNKLSSRRQILATNLDGAALIASLFSPRTSLGFIDRFILTCEAYHVPAAVFFNKMDLLGDNAAEFLSDIQHIYRNANVTVLMGSARDTTTLKPFAALLEGKRWLLAGHSGVGKSTLLNAVFPEANARVGNISNHHEKGKHTTTFAEMFTLTNGTQIIDTPGIRDFGVVDFEPQEISQYFPEMRPYLNHCKFNDCQHTHEPECAVLDALKKGEIAEERYHSYLGILNNEDIFE
jgi:ribosome biogenesis GTPase / thiamine phosphate phosphatase